MLELKMALQKLEKCNNMGTLESFYQAYLGKKWVINQAFGKLRSLSQEEKKSFWKEVADFKKALTEAYETKERSISAEEINKKLAEDIVDISLETANMKKWHFGLLAKVRREIEEICRSFGFMVEYGDEVVTKFENFQSVNIPLTHPATEMHDTIYLQEKDPQWENYILRTHTSSMQNYLIKKHGVPLKAVVPSKVYRYENLDATHDTMFYQLEGIYIDKNISIAQFKDMITKLLSAILKSDVEIRMRPGYFPFVEPGFEIDARYEIYNQKTGEKELSKWIEILGAGMIHQNVLKEADIDHEKRSGFAFGLWINRIAAMRYGIKDIRYFTNGDLRFAKSFA